jgi:hypothetical protein
MILVDNDLFIILILHWTLLIVWGTYDVEDVSEIGSALVTKSFVSL